MVDRDAGPGFESIADQFAEDIRAGKEPEVSHYADQYPQHATTIRRLFPVLEMMERRGEPVADVSESGLLAAEMESLNAMPARRHFGDFELLREVGRGGMGIVFEAQQESLERRVALKLLPSSAQFDQRRKQRFLQEAQTSGKLHHTNIVPVFGIGEHDETSFMVMQFIQGQSLDTVIDELSRIRSGKTAIRNQTTDGAQLRQSTVVDWLKDSESSPMSASSNSASGAASSTADSVSASRQLDIDTKQSHSYWKHIAQIGYQVADALSHAHSHNVLHRDIKPSNLLIDDDRRVWVTDFGLAKFFESPELTKTGEIVGTLRYMSPEQIAGKADHRSDIFALGLTLYELAALRPAYNSSDHGGLMKQVVEGHVKSVRSIEPNIPIDLATIINKCVAQLPQDRYASAELVAQDLERFCQGEPVSVRPIGGLRRAWKWCLRRPVVSSLIAALLVSIVVGFSGIAWQWQATRKALAESESNLKEARIQTAAAEEHFQQAREAVNSFFTVISEQRLLREPGFQKLRHELLTEAADYHKEFVARYEDDEELKFELAVSLYRIAEVEGSLVGSPELVKEVAKPIKILDELIEEFPEEKDYLFWKARCLRLKSKFLRRNDAIASLTTLETSVKILEQLAEAFPDEMREKVELAVQYQMLGLAHESMERASGETENSMRYYTKALVLRTEIQAMAPDEITNQVALASVYRDLGIANRRQAKFDKAVQRYVEAMTLLEKIVKENPNDDEARRTYGAVSNSVGFFYGQGSTQEDYDNALKYYELSRQQYQILSERNPLLFEFRDGYARATVGKASVLQVQGKLDEALEARFESASIREKIVTRNPKAANIRSSWAIALNGVGSTLRSLDRIEESIDYHKRAHEQHLLAIQADPAQPVLRMRLVNGLLQFARAYSRDQKFEAAVNALDEIDQHGTKRFSRPYFLKGRELIMIACRWKDMQQQALEEGIEFEPSIEQTELVDQAKAAMKKAHELGFDVVVWSQRDTDFKLHVKYACCDEFLKWLRAEFGADP